jgi:hypothetical protein
MGSNFLKDRLPMFFPPRKVVGSPNMTQLDGGVIIKHFYESDWDQCKKKWQFITVG